MTVTSGESGGAALVTHDWWCDVDAKAATDAGWLGPAGQSVATFGATIPVDS